MKLLILIFLSFFSCEKSFEELSNSEKYLIKSRVHEIEISDNFLQNLSNLTSTDLNFISQVDSDFLEDLISLEDLPPEKASFLRAIHFNIVKSGMRKNLIKESLNQLQAYPYYKPNNIHAKNLTLQYSNLKKENKVISYENEGRSVFKKYAHDNCDYINNQNILYFSNIEGVKAFKLLIAGSIITNNDTIWGYHSVTLLYNLHDKSLGIIDYLIFRDFQSHPFAEWIQQFKRLELNGAYYSI